MSQRIERQTKSQDSKTLTRHYDTFGRNVGYSVDGDRKQSITYDPATGRIAESDGFRWDYLAGSNLKSKLTYPNDAVVTWSYEPHRDLLTAVTNATYSTYVYTNDLLGRRTSKNDEQYGYNVRDELISADEVSYNYDDIGNRTTAEGKTYAANNLNQYTAIDDFTPQYDDDGNQTLIKTETGIWSVLYNAENRPIRWQSGDTMITMAFDRMGRRVEMRTVKDGEETLQRFVYDNYLCIQQLRGSDNALFQSYVWDPTEPIATRPLIFRPASGVLSYYFHDGNKNVSDLVDIQGRAVHYGYTPFGTPTSSMPSENPFGFSAEYTDDVLGLVYYNYRHYNFADGRWCSREPWETAFTLKEIYLYCANQASVRFDLLGLEDCTPHFSHTFKLTKFTLLDGLGNDCVPQLLDTVLSYLKDKISDGVTTSLLNCTSDVIASAAQQAFATLAIQETLLTGGRVIIKVVIKSELRMKWVSCCDNDIEKVEYPRVTNDIFLDKYRLDFQEVRNAISEVITKRDNYLDEFEKGVSK